MAAGFWRLVAASGVAVGESLGATGLVFRAVGDEGLPQAVLVSPLSHDGHQQHVRLIQNLHVMQADTLMRCVNGCEQADKPVDLKRARLEKDVLEGMLFRLFERQSTWNFGQLQRETDQPATWLKVRHSCRTATWA